MTHRTKYEFQATLYSNLGQMADAIAEEWITAYGENDAECVAEILSAWTDDELANECAVGWGLNKADDDMDSPESHMAYNEYDASDLAAAFREMRQ